MTEAIVAQLPALTIGVLVFAAPVAFLANARGARVVSVVAAGFEVVAAFALASVVRASGPVVYQVGGWGGPLGIDLRIDGLSAVMIALTSVIGLAVTVYSASYFGADEKYRHFWPLWLFLWAGLVALFSTNDAFNLYVCLEMASVSAVALVAAGGTRVALAAAMRYMLAAIAGSLFYLLGVALLYGALGVLDLTALASAARVAPAAQVGLALAVTGLLLKTALFPVHFWLPPAHANAPSPVSAVLSALMVKGSFYIILRLFDVLSGGEMAPALPLLLGVMGAAAIVWGSTQAFLQTRLKMLVAYSTVAQLGYLFILFPLFYSATSAEQAATAVSAGVFHAVSHALAKGAMFLAAGVVLARFGHDRIAELRGLASTAPLPAATFAIAGVSMIGLPPSGGFVSKWLYVTVALQSGAWWWAVVVLLGGLLAGAYIFRVVGIFLRKPTLASAALSGGVESARDIDDEHRELRPAVSWMPLALAVMSLLVGVLGQPILDLLAPAAAAMAGGVGL